MDAKEMWEKLHGKPGEPVPAVDFTDMKSMWAFVQDVKQRHPQGGVAISMELWQRVCSPGADIRAVSYRLRLLGMLEILLQPVYSGGQWTELALKAAAKMEMTWLPFEAPQTIDVMGFLAQAQAEAA